MEDYKNSPEGRRAAEKYASIINMDRPDDGHPKMDLVQRAKIFSPYDALRGYDESIASVDETVQEVKRPILSEEEIDVLSDKLLQVKKGMVVSLSCFEARSGPDSGDIVEMKGTVESIDPVYRTLTLAPEVHKSDAGKIEKALPTTILFDDLLDVASPEIKDIDVFLEEG